VIIVEAQVKNYFNANLEKSQAKKGIVFGNSNLRPTEDSEVPNFGAQDNFVLKDD
jgi:hypothetical protein